MDLGIARWYAPAGETQVRYDYEHLLGVALRYGCTRWMIDVRRQPILSATLSEWIIRDFFPRLQRELGHIIRLAYLRTPASDAYQQWDAAGKTRVYQGVEVFSCYTEADATSWLRVEGR